MFCNRKIYSTLILPVIVTRDEGGRIEAAKDCKLWSVSVHRISQPCKCQWKGLDLEGANFNSTKKNIFAVYQKDRLEATLR